MWLLLVMLNLKTGSSSPSRDVSSSPACEERRYSNVCEDLSYKYTSFPNLLGHQNQKEAYDALQSRLLYKHYLVNHVACHKDFEDLLCMFYFPKCGERNGLVQPPCKALCLEVRRNCEQVLGSFDWEFNCSLIEDSSDCVRTRRELQHDATLPPQRITCRNNQYRCMDNKGCIPLSQRCDGLVDCSDLSDETSCGYCSSNAFQCDNGKCVNHLQTCDGYDNCGDESDERECVRDNLIQTLIEDMLSCDCSNTDTPKPTYTDICITDTILKVRVTDVRHDSFNYKYKLRVEKVMKGDKSFTKKTGSYEMSKVDSCGCKRKNFQKRKVLYISGRVTTTRKKRGKTVLDISDMAEGSFVIPSTVMDGSEMKSNIRDCKIDSRNFSRSLAKVKIKRRP